VYGCCSDNSVLLEDPAFIWDLDLRTPALIRRFAVLKNKFSSFTYLPTYLLKVIPEPQNVISAFGNLRLLLYVTPLSYGWEHIKSRWYDMTFKKRQEWARARNRSVTPHFTEATVSVIRVSVRGGRVVNLTARPGLDPGRPSVGLLTVPSSQNQFESWPVVTESRPKYHSIYCLSCILTTEFYNKDWTVLEK